jgi:polyisoprenoid-binding protein YceI
MQKLFVTIALIMATLTLSAKNTYITDVENSEIKWVGKKVTGEHWGYVPLDAGIMHVKDGRLVSGEFTANLNLLNVKDIEDEEMNAKLEGHLKSPDFFSVAKYPQAYFKINKALVNAFASDGEPNYTLSGELTIKGKTHPITFPAIVKIEDNKINAKANFVFDRAKYDIRFNSGSFFENLGDNLIYDEIPLSINIVAEIEQEEGQE